MPDHSSRSKIRKRLPESVHEAVFAWVLKLCADKHLLTDPSVVGVDSTTIEANAAMRSIVRKETKPTYHEYVKTLMREDEMSKETPPSELAGSSATPPNDPPSPPTPLELDPSAESLKPEARSAAKVTTPEPTLAEIIRFDRKRKGKTCSNADGESATDSAS